MRARHLQHKQGLFQIGVESPDLSGGSPISYVVNPDLYNIEVSHKSGSKGKEGFQLRQENTFDCKTILRPNYFPSEIDILTVEGVNYSISNAWIDDTERIKYLRFTATQRA